MEMDVQKEMTPEEARKDHREMLVYLAVNAVFGMALGALIALAVIVLDIGGVGSRIARSSSPALAVFVLMAPMAFTFGGAVAASSIMILPYRRKYRQEPEDRAERK